MELNALLDLMVRERASDLFLKTNSAPSVRVDGNLKQLAGEAGASLDEAYMLRALEAVLDKRDRAAFDRDGEADAAYELPKVGRFRVNAFRQRGLTGFVFRHIPRKIPPLDDLNLPVDQLKKLCSRQRGLVLITGVAGSGKSTCLAAMIDFINANFRKHVVTIEDPIEFVHDDKLSVIEQREIGLDTESFASGLKHCVRQSPDVILIGEMRDRETMEAAINAAETGHLVFSTLHTVNAVQTVERIIGYFPPYLQELVRMQLAMVLEGAVSLRLLRLKGRPGRVPAAEVLIGTPTVRELLQQGKTRQIPTALRDGGYFGTQTFGQALKQLIDSGRVTEEEALAAADSPEELRMEMRGIVRGGDMRMR